jgi:uncharacterized protein (UPF0332 family)
VAILNPEHLFEQAEKLVELPASGRPRQVDIRRAISAAYYGLFHATVTFATDLHVGGTKRANSQYGLVYRSVSHQRLRELCERVCKSLPPKYASYAPPGGFGSNIAVFATAVVELQQKRHKADYDPMVRITRSDAVAAIATARAALVRYYASSDNDRTAFLSLLLFDPRS